MVLNPLINKTLSNVKEEKPVAKINELVVKQSLPKIVHTRIVFLKLGEIDTRNEKYSAHVQIDSSWDDDDLFKTIFDTKLNNIRKFIYFTESLTENLKVD